MGELIDRQAAIDAIVEWTVEDRPDIEMPTDLVGRIEALPSAQPEFTDSEIQKMQELEQAQIKKAYELGFEEGKESARREAWEDGRDRLD